MKKILCSVFLAASLAGFAAPQFKPIPIVEAETKSLTGFLNSLSNFVSKVKPEAAGQIIFASAALTMAPQTAVLDLNSYLKFVLLTGAGNKAVNQTGTSYNPDLFFCISAALKPNMEPEDDSIPFIGTSLQIYRQAPGRLLLYSHNELFKPYLKRIADQCFRADKMPDNSALRIRLNISALSKLPGVADTFKNSLMSSPNWNPAYDSLLSESGPKIADELETLLLNLRFPNASELSVSGNLKFRSGSEFSKWTMTKREFRFDGFHSFQGADEYMIAGIPPLLSFKKQILSTMLQADAPQYLQECVMRSNGAVLLASNRNLMRFKTTFGLEKGTRKPLEKALDADKSVHRLPSGIWMVDFNENQTAVYLKVLDDRLILVSGKIKEKTALGMINDAAPIPENVVLNNAVFVSYGKQKDGSFIKQSELRTGHSNLLFFFRLAASDFPKPQTPKGN